ncbi:MAG: FGGY family carbohydrate kinase [Paracoccaceae bacterium]|nr:FGGY family carbohydrate kinase [Paracoccaceae bacterium]
MRDLYLSIDVGTGSIRAALVDRTGRVLAVAAREHEQIVPRHGWSEQRPADWWAGTTAAIRDVLARVDGATDRLAAVCACGQMHGTVLVDAEGRTTREAVPLWNDKRSQPQAEILGARLGDEAMALAANLPAPAWPATKLMWLMENDAEAVERATTVLMPKDWINFRLTGRRSQDPTEASMSYLMDPATGTWSPRLVEAAGIPAGLLPPIHPATEVLGPVTADAAAEAGLPEGLPVLVGGGDYPVALLGSGVNAPGLGSDVTGTSTIVTLLHDAPVLSPDVSNIATVEGHWGSLTLLDAGGDAVRWARRALAAGEKSFEELEAAAAGAAPGAGGLLFLPYLAGERFNPNSRAQFFGLTAAHGAGELQRAVLEGVAFSVRHKLESAMPQHGHPERFVAAGGGARSALWLKIKASMYGAPFVTPEEPECGLVGTAAMAAAATGAYPSLGAAVAAMVRYGEEIVPDPEWAERYDRMLPLYADLYDAALPFFDRLAAP